MRRSCQFCGAIPEEDASHCHNCGKKLEPAALLAGLHNTQPYQNQAGGGQKGPPANARPPEKREQLPSGAPILQHLKTNSKTQESDVPVGLKTHKDSPPTYDPLALIGARVGSFTLSKILGRGGMSTVYLGEHVELRKFAAIKILKPEFASEKEANARFLIEARLIARLKHPTIVDVYDFGFVEGIGRYLTMEYLPGDTLNTYLQKHKILSPDEAMSIGWFILDALEAAHEANVIHRDLKPANIHIERRGNFNSVKLLDFGIAKLLDPDAEVAFRTQAGEVLGTPSYIAPEQAAGADIDGRTDLYSFGVILFELVTGRRPFMGRNQNETLAMQQLSPAPAPSEFVAGIPPALERLILHCLEKNPDKRPPSARALREELQAIQDGQESAPRDAAPPSSPAPQAKTSTPVSSDSKPPESSVKKSQPNLAALRALAASNPPAPPPVEDPYEAKQRLLKWLIVAMGGVGIVLISIIVYLLLAGRNPAPTPTPTTAKTQPAEHQVALDSTPSGASILNVSGQLLGKTPLVLDVPPQGIEVRFQMEGFQDLILPLQRPVPPSLQVPLLQSSPTTKP